MKPCKLLSVVIIWPTDFTYMLYNLHFYERLIITLMWICKWSWLSITKLTNSCSIQWGSMLPGLLKLDPPLGTHRHERKYVGAFVCKVTFNNDLLQPLRTHIQVSEYWHNFWKPIKKTQKWTPSPPEGSPIFRGVNTSFLFECKPQDLFPDIARQFYEIRNCQSQVRLKPKRCLGGFIFTLNK